MASLLRTAGRARPAYLNINAQNASRITPNAFRRRYASAAAAAAMPDTTGKQPFFPDEPTGPIIQTQIPGPESKKAIEKLGKVFDTRSLNMMADYSRSYGN
jgi:4-aminobutyrate aminotransferase/(S)-3-amino-2-methylpropionate transaminase